ncbi:hypothetical protein V500_03242 [Pseudogymnoascus sp. VKM F-4518 (FW-2643)]|nr:hypothetical protein V500_03242 [Pseudogymnoascus sp. VKM F-4518 (FW-2643)]
MEAFVASRLLAMRRLVLAVASWFINPRFVFAFATVSILGAKLVHIYSHLSALPTADLLQWGYSFFAQDMALMIIVRLLLDRPMFAVTGSWLRLSATTVAVLIVAYVAALATISISFFAVVGSEIHWRNIGFASNASSWALLLTGIGSFVLVLCGFVVLAWVFQDVAFLVAGYATDFVKWPFANCTRIISPQIKYSKIQQHDAKKYEETQGQHGGSVGLDSKSWPWPCILRQLRYSLVGIALLAQVILHIFRPQAGSLTFMSWTSALLPFVDFRTSSNLRQLQPLYGSAIDRNWDNRTALDVPIPLSWLPNDSVLKGFEDWHAGKQHYNAAMDPLKISNTEEDLLPLLRNKLGNVPIRHIMLILLESTRKDVFPIKKDELIWQRFANSFENKTLPEEARHRLETLTPYANFLTGDYDDGFEHDSKTKQRRGGLNFNDAYTTGTYTIKSMVGTLCGITPLVADFNLEYLHHIYQPCLPQILEAFSTLDRDNDTDHFTSYKWRSSFLESVILYFDNLELLMSTMGFPDENIISKEYLRGGSAKFGTVHLPDTNYFGMPEICLEDYIRDTFASAKQSNERVFLTHLTSTSHHPFAMPDNEPYVPLSKGLDNLSHYVNSIGYDDRWLGRILDVLDEEGVSNETLVVLVGDHGLSLPENDIVASYYNPNVGSNHIPLVMSHPKLPPIDIDDAVSSLQILPTILDLLLETGSLSESAIQAARDLVDNYEGQSLVRPMRRNNQSNITGSSQAHGDWQFTIINPGAAMLGVRDARPAYRGWRLVVPVDDNVRWRFTSMDSDPTEEHPTAGFDFGLFLRGVEKRHGIEAARWAEDGAFVARWWVEENSKRWRYGQYDD